MQILKINRTLCNNCLCCHRWLPYLLFNFVDDQLLISDTNPSVQWLSINRAIENCKPQALTLEKVCRK